MSRRRDRLPKRCLCVGAYTLAIRAKKRGAWNCPSRARAHARCEIGCTLTPHLAAFFAGGMGPDLGRKIRRCILQYIARIGAQGNRPRAAKQGAAGCAACGP